MSAAGFMAEVLATYHLSARARERKRSLLARGGRLPQDGLKSAAIRRKSPTLANRVEDRTSFGSSPLGQHVLDPRPARAGRPDVGLALETALQAIEPSTYDIDAGERGSIER